MPASQCESGRHPLTIDVRCAPYCISAICTPSLRQFSSFNTKALNFSVWGPGEGAGSVCLVYVCMCVRGGVGVSVAQWLCSLVWVVAGRERRNCWDRSSLRSWGITSYYVLCTTIVLYNLHFHQQCNDHETASTSLMSISLLISS